MLSLVKPVEFLLDDLIMIWSMSLINHLVWPIVSGQYTEKSWIAILDLSQDVSHITYLWGFTKQYSFEFY